MVVKASLTLTILHASPACQCAAAHNNAALLVLLLLLQAD
jgi:hypothetical protein